MTTTTCVRSLKLLLSRSSFNLGQTPPTKLLTKIHQPINCISSTAALTSLRLSSRSVCSAHISHQQVSLSVLQNTDLKRPHQRRQYRVPSGIQWSNCIHRRNMSDSIVPNPPNLVFRQLFDYQSYTYTYLLADKDTKDAILIDPVVELVKRDMHLLEDLGLNLIYAINTHCHADHITGTGVLKEKLPGCKSIISKYSGAKSDLTVVDGDQIKFGNLALDVVATPGHTDGCVTYILRNAQGTPVMAFTGDAILIRGCGRTDFQQGDAGRLYDSVHGKILSLPAETRLHPAHDYTGQTVTTVGEERKFNPRLTKTKEEFIKIMEQLNLPYPKAIDKALPANLVCGIVGEEYQ